MTEVAAQKRETEVRSALREAQRIGQADPGQAVENLKKVLVDLADDTVLSPDLQQRLVHLLKERIRAFETQAKRPAQKQEAPTSNPRRRAEEQIQVADYEKIRAALDKIRALQRDGQTEEARRQAQELVRSYAGNPVLEAAVKTTAAADLLANHRRDKSDSERRLASASRDISRSATPPLTELEYPEDWQKRIKNRSGMDSSFTEKEKAILRALNTPISVDFKGSRIEEVVEYLSNAIKQPIVLDNAALGEAQIGYDTPITAKLERVALRTVLRKILGELGLAYVIKDQSLQITSAVRAKEMMIVRTYYLGDLLGSGGIGNSFGFPLGNQNNATFVAQQAATIIDSITSTVEPSSWQKNGGSGNITFSAPLMALIVRQSAEVHAILAGGS
jgi:hypothetical protein